MLGESAGRSAGNSPRREARRRFEESERTKNTPLLDDPSYWGEEEFPNKVRMRDWFLDVVASVVFGIITLGLLVLSHAPGLAGIIGNGVLVTYVMLISYRAYNLNRKFGHHER